MFTPLVICTDQTFFLGSKHGKNHEENGILLNLASDYNNLRNYLILSGITGNFGRLICVLDSNAEHFFKGG